MNVETQQQKITGWWLGHPSEKYEFVSWDDEIPNINGNMPKMATKPPTRVNLYVNLASALLPFDTRTISNILRPSKPVIFYTAHVQHQAISSMECFSRENSEPETIDCFIKNDAFLQVFP